MTSFSELAQSRSNNLMNETKKHFNTDYLNKTTKEDRIKAFYKAKGEIQDEDSYLKEIKTKVSKLLCCRRLNRLRPNLELTIIWNMRNMAFLLKWPSIHLFPWGGLRS